MIVFLIGFLLVLGIMYACFLIEKGDDGDPYKKG